jgi:hypothetical protein
MLFWLLALVLLASLAGVGFRQGAVRVAFSFVGILAGALLAGPLGKLVKPLLVNLGLKTPALAWLLAPVVVFVVISIIFKVAGLMVHQKVDVHFKYHVGDLRLALWERLTHRLGLCLGVANGALYLILISAVIYPLSYWSFQLATEDQDPKSMRILNWLGQDLQRTGFAKVARALDPMPQLWYDCADLAGLLYNNPLSDARLARYPAFLGLAERSEFKEMAGDAQFSELRLGKKPILTLLEHPKAQAMIQNPGLLQAIWTTVVPDLNDLQTFLQTGKSPKYDPERILGRWTFNVKVALALLRKAKPNLTSKEMQSWRGWMTAAFAKTSFVAMTDHQALLKSVSQLRLPAAGTAPTGGPQNLKGQWQGQNGKYQLTLSGGVRDEQLTATVEGDRLTITGEGVGLVFDRED